VTARFAPAVLIVALCACGGGPPAGGTVDRAADAYVRLVLALAERDPDSLDHYSGPPSLQREAERQRRPLAGIRSAASSLADSLGAASGGGDADVRRAFLVRQLRAVAARAAIVDGARPRFDDEARDLFGIQPGDEPAGGSGGSDTAARAADERAFVIPRDRVPAVLARAVQGCRAATASHVRLPASESVAIEFVPDLAWSAFTTYEGQFHSRIRVNARLPMTVDGALEVACHEAYPGHHTIETLIDARYGGSRPEFRVQPLFSPQSLLHEGAASAAPALAFSAEERVAFERDVLFPLAGLDPAGAARSVAAARAGEAARAAELALLRRYLDGDLDFPRASEALARELPGSAADDTLKFANQFRTYVATYVVGRALTERWLDAHATGGADARWRAYVDLVTGPAQTVNGVGSPAEK